MKNTEDDNTDLREIDFNLADKFSKLSKDQNKLSELILETNFIENSVAHEVACYEFIITPENIKEYTNAAKKLVRDYDEKIVDHSSAYDYRINVIRLYLKSMEY